MAEMAEATESGFDSKCGLVIAIFAAAMSLSDVFAGKYGEDQARAINDKSAAYMWYQAKSIRASMTEGQRDLLSTLQSANVFNRGPASEAIVGHLQQLDKKLVKYEKQKNEILVGSKALKQADWAQDIDGKFGQVVGTKDFEYNLSVYEKVSDNFDLAALFFQICVVMGAVALITKKQASREKFFYAMILLGVTGSGFSLMAFYTVQSIG